MFFTFDKWVMHEQLEQNQVLRRMPLLPCGNCILRASQELRENSRSSFCIGECMVSWILSPEIYPESPNLVHMWRVMWFKHLSGAEDGHSAPLPCHGKCSEVIKTPIFAAVLRCTGDLGVPMLLSLRSSRGYCGLEQCQGQSPLGNVTASPAQAASTWLPLRAGLANAELASPWRKIRLDKCFYPSNVTLWSQWWSVLEWSGKSCVGAAWAVARVGELCSGCGRLCRGKLEE